MLIEAPEADETWPESEDEDVKILGFYPVPRVLLESRKPTKKEMFIAMAEKMEQTINLLKIVYRTEPAGISDEQEDNLIELLNKTKNLKK